MPKSQTKSNIYLFSGEDDFSLRRKIELWKKEFAKKYSSQAICFFDGSQMPENELIKQLQDQLAPSLFSTKKLIIIRDGLPSKATQAALIDFILALPGKVPQDFLLVFWQTQKLDGRLGFTKKFLARDININEFTLPHGLELNGWIKAMAKNLSAEITDQAADLLAQFLGRDLFEEKKFGGRVVERKEAFDLWQAYSELNKLATAQTVIDPQGVKNLIKPKIPDSVFSLSDNLAQGEQKQAYQSLENYLENAGGDEKLVFIKVVGLLAEQFRSLLLVRLLSDQKLDNAEIAEKLGWSTGRIFILSKHARNFSVAILTNFLNQLLNIDYKLKSSDNNPRLLVDLFIASTKT
ncbi:MAG TPA: hypothetical protein VL306_00030 [Methylomirabilota bacterium]|jgi:DNA polymerase-3 subunit delta|nr:hypothetical protein [Methylomirabilota bacterium]